MRSRRYSPLEVPNYTLDEATRFLHVPRRTLRDWVFGTDCQPALLAIAPEPPYLLSFKDLVECHMLESLRTLHGVNFRRVRQAVQQLQARYPKRPRLADHEIKTEGLYVYLDEEELINLSLGGQAAIKPILDTFLRRVERDEDGIARRLFPFVRKVESYRGNEPPKVVEINPTIQFGVPVLVGTRVSTAHLVSRRLGGDSIEAMAKDYGRSPSEIKEAIEWQLGKRRAAA